MFFFTLQILKDLEALFENLSSKPDLFQFQNPTLPLGNDQNMERWLARLMGGSARSSITKSSAIHNMLEVSRFFLKRELESSFFPLFLRTILELKTSWSL